MRAQIEPKDLCCSTEEVRKERGSWCAIRGPGSASATASATETSNYLIADWWLVVARRVVIMFADTGDS